MFEIFLGGGNFCCEKCEKPGRCWMRFSCKIRIKWQNTLNRLTLQAVLLCWGSVIHKCMLLAPKPLVPKLCTVVPDSSMVSPQEHHGMSLAASSSWLSQGLWSWIVWDLMRIVTDFAWAKMLAPEGAGKKRLKEGLRDHGKLGNHYPKPSITIYCNTTFVSSWPDWLLFLQGWRH